MESSDSIESEMIIKNYNERNERPNKGKTE